MIDENKSDDQVHIICEPSLKTSQNYPSYKSNSTDITSIKDNIIKNEKIYKIISPKRSLETANDVVPHNNQPIFQNLYNINNMRSKFYGYKITINDIKNKSCPLSLKIIILKSLRNNLVSLIKQNKQLIKEKKRCQQLTFEENLNLIGQTLLESNNNPLIRKIQHKKNASTTSRFNTMNKQKTTHPKQSSQHTLVSNQSTNDGNGEEEKFVDNLFHSIADEEERLIEIKNFRINIAIQLDDVKEDLQFEKKMLMDKMKKLEEQSMKIEQIKLKITNMSQKKDFLKNLIKSKTSIQKSQKIRTTTNFTSRDEISTISINTSRLNVSFVDEFSHGFNTIWNKLVTKFNSRQNKINNVLDSFSSLDQTKI